MSNAIQTFNEVERDGVTECCSGGGGVNHPRDRALEEAYCNANYQVSLPAGPVELRVGQSAPVLDDWLATVGVQCWVVLTAVNPGSVLLSASENEQRLFALQKVLGSLNYKVLDARGIDWAGVWPDEPGFFVAGMPVVEALELGQRFGQNALIAGDIFGEVRLIWLL